MLALRKIIALILLAVCSYTDIKEKNIYIIHLLIADILGTLIFVYDAITMRREITGNFFLYLILFLLGFLFLFYMRIRGSMFGEGDFWLIISLSILLGINLGMRIFIYGIILAGFAGLFLVILKKNKAKGTIAFAPFLMIGYILILVGI